MLIFINYDQFQFLLRPRMYILQEIKELTDVDKCKYNKIVLEHGIRNMF